MNWFKKKRLEPKIEPISNHTLNTLELRKNINESEYTLGKRTDEEYITEYANIKKRADELSAKHVSALEEVLH